MIKKFVKIKRKCMTVIRVVHFSVHFLVKSLTIRRYLEKIKSVCVNDAGMDVKWVKDGLTEIRKRIHPKRWDKIIGAVTLLTIVIFGFIIYNDYNGSSSKRLQV